MGHIEAFSICWYLMLLTTALGRWRQVDFCEYQSSLIYVGIRDLLVSVGALVCQANCFHAVS